jgi:hypothetical protein
MTPLHTTYLIWAAVGLPLLIIGWLLLARIENERVRLLTRAFLAAIVLAFIPVGTHGAFIPLPAWRILGNAKGVVAGSVAILIWWGLFVVLLRLISKRATLTEKGNRG